MLYQSMETAFDHGRYAWDSTVKFATEVLESIVSIIGALALLLIAFHFFQIFLIRLIGAPSWFVGALLCGFH